jgi:hypothetical protein
MHVRDGSKHFVKRLGRLWLAWQVDDGRTLPLIPAVCLDSTAVGTNFNEMASSALPARHHLLAHSFCGSGVTSRGDGLYRLW